VVRRRQAQRRVQLRRPARRGRQRRPRRHPLEGEPGDTRAITYAELKDEVSKAANALTELGVEKGDRVAIYMPMIPEAVVAMLACARIGAAHTVVFGGFSADALATRIQDADAKLVITADGGYRRGQAVRAQAGRRRGGRAGDRRRARARVRRTGQDVAWTRAATCGGTRSSTGSRRAHARGVRRRAPAVHPLHLGHDG
jgi:acyl-coenzyme A synthetase/AMP-(fatty) acid ligase